MTKQKIGYSEIKVINSKFKIKKKTMEDLFDQIVNISKSSAYDVLAGHVKELKEVIRDLIEKGELDDLEFTEANDTAEFKTILNRAKILSVQ
jgi:hypothetical protein